MIENLKGIKETVNLKKDTYIQLYNNADTCAFPPHWHIPFELIMPVCGSYKAICNHSLYEKVKTLMHEINNEYSQDIPYHNISI